MRAQHSLPLNRRALSSRCRQILTPVIEIAVHELDDLPRVRLHIQEEADSRRVVLSPGDTRFDWREFVDYHTIAPGAEKLRKLLRNELVEFGVVTERVGRRQDLRHVLSIAQ